MSTVPSPVALEPRFGYAVHGRLGVIERSLPRSEHARRRSERQYFNGVPSLYSLLRRGDGVARVEAALSLRHPFDFNYYHATIDCLGELAWCEELGLLSGRTVVVGPGLAGTAPFQAIVNAGVLDGVDWTVQHSWIEAARDVMFVRVGQTATQLRRTLAFLERAATPRLQADPPVKLYLTRDSGEGRRLRNERELRSGLEQLGYEAIDPSTLGWDGQVQLFRRATHVVGIHGAAFTNILYRGASDLRVVEIHQPGGGELMYRRMCEQLGYEYRCVEGSNASEAGNRPLFDVNVDDVLRAVRAEATC